jgi:hypothetical protein
MGSLENFNKACEAFKDRQRQHSEGDFQKLLSKPLMKSLRRVKWLEKEECKKGNHGFNTRTWLGGGMIHTRCDNCGASWSNPDVPCM